MREIKFRYWNGEKMFYKDEWNRFPIVADGEVFLEYTGIQDKNGKEIYEGDIVKGLGGNKDVGVVFFSRGCFLVEDWYNGMSEGDFSDHPDFEKTEIIGNIYKSPELLTK